MGHNYYTIRIYIGVLKHLKKMNKEEKIRISRFLRFQREKNKISYRQLQQKSKISKNLLCILEGSEGYNFNTTIDTLDKVLSCYNKNLLDLFEYVYKKNSNNINLY